MAFCNSCGNTLAPGAQFCAKCGAATGETPSPASAATTPATTPPSTGGSSALKVILIVIAVIVGILILGMVTCGVVIHHIAKSSHQEGDRVKVETPFGTINANDPEQTAKDLGIDIYPAAQVQKEGTASVTVFGIHTVTANFTSTDSVDKVCDFYKSRFPAATVRSSDQNRCSIVSNDPQASMTINIEASGDVTKFQIVHVNKKPSN